MDELLRSYASKRRELGRNEIHPATRRMLQGEITRVYSAEEQTGHRHLPVVLRRFWPQFAFGLSLFIILIGFVLPSHFSRHKNVRDTDLEFSREKVPPGNSPQMLENADLQRSQNAQGVEAPPNVAKSSPAEEVKIEAQHSAKEPAPIQLKDALETENKPEALTQPILRKELKELPVGRDRSSGGIGSLGVSRNGIQPVVPQAAPPEPQKKAEAPAGVETVNRGVATASKVRVLSAINSLTNLGNALRVTFHAQSNLLANARGFRGAIAPASTTPPLLANFQFEQLGDRVRLIDADGSVYDGIIQPAGGTNLPVTMELNVAPMIDNAAIVRFQASGTNQTFGEPVLITGQLLERTNQLPSPENTFAFKSVGTVARGVVTNGVKVTASRMPMRALVGTAILGDTNSISIRALSNEP